MEERRSAFVLASVMGHAMILSRLDYKTLANGDVETGVGRNLLEFGHNEGDIAALLCDLAGECLTHHGPGVVFVDGGANIGTHSVTLARHMGAGTDKPWGKVLAFEVQEWTYYALCGNLALNNCFNAGAMRVALGNRNGSIQVPIFDPRVERNVGGTSLLDDQQTLTEQYATKVPVPIKTIDSMGFMRLDLMKLDVEGMEAEILEGASRTIARCRPIMVLEWFKCGKEAIENHLPDYELMPIGIELLAIHKADPMLKKLQFVGGEAERAI